MLDHESPGVHAGPRAAIPAERAAARQALERSHGLADVGAFFVLAQEPMLDPPPAVRADIVAGLDDGARGVGIALQGKRATEDGERQSALLEQAHHAPEADPAAELVDRLDREVARAVRHLARALRQRRFREAVAIGHRILGALLVVQYEVDRNARATGPCGVRWIAPVAGEIARECHEGPIVWREDRTREVGSSVDEPVREVPRPLYIERHALTNYASPGDRDRHN